MAKKKKVRSRSKGTRSKKKSVSQVLSEQKVPKEEVTKTPVISKEKKSSIKETETKLSTSSSNPLYTDQMNQVRDQAEGFKDKWKTRSKALWFWYQGKPLGQKILLGTIIIPVLLILLTLNSVILPVILPFLPVIGGFLLASAKITLIFAKFSAFAVYIIYKIIKTFLGFYYCITRTLSGRSAQKMRMHQSTLSYGPNEEYPHLKVEGINQLKFEFKWKRMTLSSSEPAFYHPFLMSYLRYFLLGQFNLWKEGWNTKQEWLQFWKSEKRTIFTELLAHAGGTIFAPHLLGPHLKEDRIVVPGDARLVSIKLNEDRIHYHFEIPWKTWKFQIKQRPWVSSTPHRSSWKIDLPFKLSTLSNEEYGYQSHVVDLDSIPSLNPNPST